MQVRPVAPPTGAAAGSVAVPGRGAGRSWQVAVAAPFVHGAVVSPGGSWDALQGLMSAARIAEAGGRDVRATK